LFQAYGKIAQIVYFYLFQDSDILLSVVLQKSKEKWWLKLTHFASMGLFLQKSGGCQAEEGVKDGRKRGA
jgi:hypothetical protein